METISIALSIVASVLSIAAAIVAIGSKKEVGRLRNLYEGNDLSATGNGNAQIVGAGNQVITHGKR